MNFAQVSSIRWQIKISWRGDRRCYTFIVRIEVEIIKIIIWCCSRRLWKLRTQLENMSKPSRELLHERSNETGKVDVVLVDLLTFQVQSELLRFLRVHEREFVALFT